MVNQINTPFGEVGSDDVLDFHKFVFRTYKKVA